MELNEAIELIRYEGIAGPGASSWADLGCGSGLFSRALAALLPTGSTVYAIDKEPVKIAGAHGAAIQNLQLDFVANDLPLQNLDGILMANSLHYVKDQYAFIKKAGSCLKAGAGFLIIEYDTDKANPWVPYPLSYHSLLRLFHRAGYPHIIRLQERASIYGRADIYSVLVTPEALNR
ncbi:class I SAM-dependent methyltransferase [uncultured Chitinophaga sp.]|jgi:Methylase involved in ubiquinone/menaquinone biosynthesis|uniref:class I SAM-dependent methyltransferase n=1 Tax=uncultured Chitinophaga sp. TaxID=339340 RepID=UPI0026275316|nr:class I SAM-dependent methyltransferase [uncultured Chitinophaga sp.]